MLLSSARCCLVVSRHHGMPMKKNGIVQAISGYGNRSKHDKGSCCKDVAQTEGKRVEPWPKNDPPPAAWRCSCPTGPQPPNYDPYRIKVPDVVVPPLPPSNAKEITSEDARELFKEHRSHIGGTCPGTVQDLFYNSPIVHPDYWKPKPEKKLKDIVTDVLPKLGYHGKNKYKYAFHEPWKPLDRMTLLEQAEKEESVLIDESEIAEKTDVTGL